jgi:ribosomal protein S12 methylthiotransferase accessory factor
LRAFVTLAGFLGSYTTWSPDVSGAGLGFDEQQAQAASLGEAVERYCGNYVPELSTLLLTSEVDLSRNEVQFLSLSTLQLFDQKQQNHPAWPFAGYDPQLPIYWVQAGSLHEEQEPLLVPAESVYLNWTRVTRLRPQVPVNLAGIAAHRSLEEAELAALRELVERDASMCWWHAGAPSRKIVNLPGSLLEILRPAANSMIQKWFLLLPTELPLYVVSGCLYDSTHQILCVGFAARECPAEAIKKAAAEAWQLRLLSLQMVDECSPMWREIRAGRFPLPALPYRRDRRYVEVFDREGKLMDQLAYNLQYYLDPSTHERALARLGGEPVDFGALTELTTSKDHMSNAPSPANFRRCLLEAMSAFGLSSLRVDLTTEDMLALGYRVVRVVCPGLVWNTPTSFIPWEHPRLKEAITKSKAGPFPWPMPHA